MQCNQPVNHVVHMDLGGNCLRGSHHKDCRASQLRDVSVPKGVRHMAHPFSFIYIFGIIFFSLRNDIETDHWEQAPAADLQP